jgi:hypothetical protein
MDGALKALVRQGTREWDIGLQIHRFAWMLELRCMRWLLFYELISAKYTPRGIFAKLFFNALQVSGT